MPTNITILPTVAANPAQIAELQLKTGHTAVTGLRGNVDLIDLRQPKPAPAALYNQHVKAWRLACFEDGMAFLRRRYRQLRRERTGSSNTGGYQPDPAA